MKDYKRLTSKDDSLCTDCAGIGFCKKTCIMQARYERLQLLENEIESGKIDYITDRDKEISRLTAENQRLREEAAEQKSIAEHEHAMQMEWFNVACDYKAENAELQKRLDNTIELPCGIGDTIYTVIKNCAYCKHYNMGWAECKAPATANFDSESTHRICFTQDIVTDECKKHLCVAELKFDLRFLNPKTGELEPQYFVDREAAEARLREIQEGRDDART